MRFALSSQHVLVAVPFDFHSIQEPWNLGTISWFPFPNWASLRLEQQLNEGPSSLCRMPNGPKTQLFEWFFPNPSRQQGFHSGFSRTKTPSSQDQCVGTLSKYVLAGKEPLSLLLLYQVCYQLAEMWLLKKHIPQACPPLTYPWHLLLEWSLGFPLQLWSWLPPQQY